MTNVYFTTLLGGAITTAGAAGLVVTTTVDGVKSVKKGVKERDELEEKREKRRENIAESTNFNDVVAVLRELNPEVEIYKPKGTKDKIIFVEPTDEFVLPNGFHYDPNLGITNKDNTQSGKFINIAVANLENVDRNLLESEEDRIEPKAKIDKAPFKDLVSTTVVSASSTTLNTLMSHDIYADTYDTKTYMDAQSDKEIVEFADELANYDLENLVIEEPEIVNVKKLVK